jgi:hypothetical protein
MAMEAAARMLCERLIKAVLRMFRGNQSERGMSIAVREQPAWSGEMPRDR